jgi:predicted ATPase/DNA-binding response OmpR family regulator/tetratricopeptide (TPR) repeat protein
VTGPQLLTLSSCTVDFGRRRVTTAAGEVHRLSTREWELLRYLVARESTDVHRDELLREIWGYADNVLSRASDSAVARLREKIEADAAAPTHLLTVHGHGYRFEPVSTPLPAPQREQHPEDTLDLGGIQVDLRRLRCLRPDGVRDLSAREARILAVLRSERGRALERGQLARRAWDGPARGRAVDNAIRRLRLKIELDPAAPAALLTVPGVGYRLALADSAPVGQVTLVMSAVPRRAHFWRVLDQGFTTAVATHDQILAAQARAHHGHGSRAGPESWLVVFGRAADAIDFCIACQEALHQAPWSEELLACSVERPGLRGLPVAIGVHHGTPLRQVDPSGSVRWLGPVVDHTARLAAAAFGGQIVLSDAAWARVTPMFGRSEPPGEVTPLGEQRFDDGREWLWQLVPVTLSGRCFPPLATDAVVPTNLPSPASSLVGRRAELAGLLDLVERERIVSVVGMAGVGKTRLVLAAGADLLPRVEGGVWFVDASAARDRSDLCEATTKALGMRLPPGDPADRLGENLGRRGNVVLILDNLEHLVAAAAPLVARWLEAAPDLRIMTASRAPLLLPGEARLALEPLSIADGATLFEQRARAVRSGFRIDDQNRAAVHALVGRLEGLCLAIELAACRVGMLSPARLLSRLDEGLTLLDAGRGENRTLRGALEWSWNLLSPHEQHTLGQIAVFVGGFSLEAAEETVRLDREADVLGVLAALVDQSLVQVREPLQGIDRYHLFASVRRFALDKLGTPDTIRGNETGPNALQAMRMRHARWFGRLGTKAMLGRLRLDGLPRRRALQLETDNLLAARDTADADGKPDLAARIWLATSQSMLSPVQQAAEGVLMVDGQRPRARGPESLLAAPLRADTRARILHTWGWQLGTAGQVDPAMAAFDEAITLFRDADDPQSEARVQTDAGFVLGTRRGGEEAVRRCEQAVVLARRVAEPTTIGRAEGHHALLHHQQGRTQVALTLCQQALERGRRLEDLVLQAHAASWLGTLLHMADDLAAAAPVMRQAAELAGQVGDIQLRGTMLGNLGNLLRVQGHLGEARRCLRQALAVHRELGARGAEATTLAAIAHVDLYQGPLADAEAGYRSAARIHRELGTRRNELTARLGLGETLTAMGRFTEARTTLEAVLTALESLQEPVIASLAVGNLGELELAEGHSADARACLEQAVEGSARAGAIGMGLAMRAALAEARFLCGDPQGLPELREAVGELRARPHAYALARGLLRLVAVYRATDNAEEAHAALAEARRVAEPLEPGVDSELGRLLD